MSNLVKARNICIEFDSKQIRGLEYLEFVRTKREREIALAELFDIDNLIEILVNAFFDDSAATDVGNFNRHHLGELSITFPRNLNIVFPNVMLRSQLKSHRHDETKGLIWVQFKAIGEKREKY